MGFMIMMMIQRVERHLKKNNRYYKEICFKSKNLYNYCNYILRQVYLEKFENIESYKDLVQTYTNKKNKSYYYIKEYDLTTRLAKLNQIDYRALPAQTSQQIIKLVFKNWKSYFKSIKSYWNNKKKYKAKPKLPNYKNKKGFNIVIFTNQNIRLKGNKIYFPKITNLPEIITKQENIKQVRVIPYYKKYIIEVVYKKEIKKKDLYKDRYLSIDLGINNLLVTSNNFGLKPIVINGKLIKSLNQYYNKKRALLMSYIGDKGTSNRLRNLDLKRNNKISDSLHKVSRFLINYCVANKIQNIVIGYNKSWKQKINIGKNNNQKFVNIPYLKLINMIIYKGEEVGIEVQLVKESYTSKVDSLALEKIKKHTSYKGKRIKRGLFRSSINQLINADVNGSINILRKVIGDSFVKKILDRGVGVTPNRLTIY